MNPGFDPVQRIRRQADRANAAGLFRGHDAGALEHLKVFQERGAGHRKGLRQLRDRGGPVHQPLDHRQAGRVREGAEDAMDRGFLCSHKAT